jgi:3D (Asp-Asp-Asp) domain-containing protein
MLNKNQLLASSIFVICLVFSFLLPQALFAQTPSCRPDGWKEQNVTCETMNPKCCEGLYCYDKKGDYVNVNTNTGGRWDPDIHTIFCEKSPQEHAYEQEQKLKIPDFKFIPQVTIPGSLVIGGKTFTIKKGEGITVTNDTAAQYFALFYRFFVAALAVCAIVMVMWGGFKRIMAAGSPERVKSANETIIGAITGVVIALISYSLLSLINPALVSFKTLQISPVTAEPFSIRAGLLKNPGAAKIADEFKELPCPTEAQLLAGVEFYATGYYKPAYGDAEDYQSFECNVAMQCSCPLPPGLLNASICEGGGKKWNPCKHFDKDVPYCNQVGAKKCKLTGKYCKSPSECPGTNDSCTLISPTAWTTAATSKCLPVGTVFKVFGSPQSGVNTAVWIAEDTGGWISGRRIDLFFGEGRNAYKQAVKATGKVTVKVCPNNDKNSCPTN